MKIGYSKTYPILVNGQWEKIWIEHDTVGELNEEEIRKQLYSLKKQVEKFHYESNAAAEKQMGTNVVDNRLDNLIGSLEDQISTVTDVKVLESYRLLVKNKPEAEKAFLNKLKELSHA